MSNQIVIQFSVEDAAAFKAWQRQQQAAARMKKELDALKKSGNQAGQALIAGAQNAGRQALSAVAALTGIGGAVSAIMAVANQLKVEVANIRSVQSEAGGTQIDFGKALAQAVKNIGGAMDPVKFRQAIIDAAARAGVSESKMATVVGAAAAGVGTNNEADVKAVISSAELVAKAYPELEQAEQGIAALGVTSIKRAAGLSDQEAIGLGLQGAAQHKSDTTQKFVTNVLGDVPKLMDLNTTAQEAMGILSTFSQLMGDVEGSTSGTAAIVTLKELAERFPEIPTAMERIKKVQSSPEEFKKYMEGGEYHGRKFGEASMGRGDAYTTVRGLMRGNSKQVDDLKERTAAIGGKDKWTAATEANSKALDSLFEVVQNRIDNTLKSATAGVQVANMSGGAGGIARDNLQQILKAAGLSDLEVNASIAKFEWNTGLGGKLANQEVVRQLTAQASDMKNPLVPEYVMPMGGIGASGAPGVTYRRDPTKATDEDRLKANRLELAAKALVDLDKLSQSAKQQAQLSGQVPQSVRVAMGEARQATMGLEGDTNVTPDERDAVRDKVNAATQEVRASQGAISDATARELLGALFQMKQSLDANSKSTEQNTKVNQRQYYHSPARHRIKHPAASKKQPSLASLQSRCGSVGRDGVNVNHTCKLHVPGIINAPDPRRTGLGE